MAVQKLLILGHSDIKVNLSSSMIYPEDLPIEQPLLLFINIKSEAELVNDLSKIGSFKVDYLNKYNALLLNTKSSTSAV